MTFTFVDEEDPIAQSFPSNFTFVDENEPQPPEEENIYKKGLRSILQVPAGIARLGTIPLDFLKQVMLAEGYAGTEELEEAAQKEDVPFDTKKYLERVEQAGKAIPTQELFEEKAEEVGIPIKAKTGFQKGIRNTSELISFVGGPKVFSDLIFEQLPKAAKELFVNKPKTLFDKLVGGEPLPESVYETAENILKEIETRFTPVASNISPSLAGRVTKTTSPIEIKIPTDKNLTPKRTFEEIGESISPIKIKNEFTGGSKQVETIQKAAKEARNNVKSAYEEADAEIEGISDIYPELNLKLVDLRDKILAGRELKLLNPAEKDVVTTLDNLIEELEPVPGTYQDLPVKTLVKTADSWAGKINHENIYGNVKQLLNSAVRDLNQTAIQTLRKSGRNADKLLKADEIYADFADRYANDDIIPFLKSKVRNQEELYRKSLNDESTFRALQDALGKTKEGKEILSSTTREIVEKRLSPYIKDPSKIHTPEFEKALNNLEPFIGENNVDKIRKSFQPLFKAQRKPIGKVYRKTPLKAVEAETSIFLEMTPEKIASQMNSRTGIKQLKKELDKSSRGRNLFNTLKRQKIRDTLKNNKINKKLKGSDLYEVLNDRKNHEIFTELLGKEETDVALEAAKKIGEKRFTSEALKKIGEHALAIKFYKFIYPLIP